MNNIITFEIGDIAHCPYYNYTGIIKEFKQANGQNYIILHDPNKQPEHTCSAKIVTESLNYLHPVYLQLVMKKADYEKINKIKVFGHI